MDDNKHMREVFLGLSFILAVCSALPIINSWFESFLLNMVAEILGFIIAFAVGIHLASKAANKRIIELAPKVLKVIKHLREDKVISPATARSIVVLAAHILSADSLKSIREGLTCEVGKCCPVCDLLYKCTTTTDCATICSECKLPNAAWGDAVNDPPPDDLPPQEGATI